jgi:cell volume regulation protein A
MASEPHATELLLFAVGVLLLASVLVSRFASSSGVPVLVLFLALGMLAGSEGIGRVYFEDYELSFRVGTIALVLILFDGGLNTPLSVLRKALAPATLLATVGLALTAVVVALGAHALGFGWTEGFLVGAIVAPTDAAAVFSVLRGGTVQVDGRVGPVVELESTLNDPTGVLATMALTTTLMQGTAPHLAVLGWLTLQLVVGAAVGVVLARVAGAMLARLELPANALYPVLSIAIALLSFGAAALVHGSGFLAVVVVGMLLGQKLMKRRDLIVQVHDFVAWAAQITMFLVLGLLVFPTRVVAVVPTGLGIALLLTLVARPAAVAVCLLPFGYGVRRILLVSWLGLRGAVPIILAMIPVLADAREGPRIFNVVFFVVLVSATLQGTTARWVTKVLAPTPASAPPTAPPTGALPA